MLGNVIVHMITAIRIRLTASSFRVLHERNQAGPEVTDVESFAKRSEVR